MLAAVVKINVRERGRGWVPSREKKLGRNHCYETLGRAETGPSSRASGSGMLWDLTSRGPIGMLMTQRTGSRHHHHLWKVRKPN